MELIRKQLADGVRLSYLETDKFKTGFLSVNFIVPLEADAAAKNALIPAILTRGSVKYPTLADINKKLDYLYAASISTRNEKRGEVQVFGVTASMIDPAYTMGGEDLVSEVTDMLFEILLCPKTEGGVFDSAYTESEKKNLIDAINAKINNKAQYALQRCISEMCADEPFGLLETGTVEEVSACSAESVYAQYKYALGHYPIEIFFVGKCDIGALTEKLSGIFAGIARDVTECGPAKIVRKAESVKHIDEDMPVNQGKLSIGFRTGCVLGEDDYYAMMMFNAVYGGGVTSKLFMNVREKMSLCYYCSSSPVVTKGIMMVNSGIEVANREIAEKAIFDQLEAVKAGDFTEEELESARLGTINSYRELSDSARGLESWYLTRVIFGVDNSPETDIERFLAVTREEIVEAANKITPDTVYFLNGTLKGEGEDD